jgi:folate-binding Fe-S cluster repair protein YgfZ
MTATAAILSDRRLLEIAGEERASFLQGLITNDVAGLGAGQACFAGLLSPQGKILAGFFAINAGDTILLDCPGAAAAELLKRLTFYKLRAKVTLADVSDRWRIAAAWGEGAGEALKASASIAFEDPRLSALGFRGLISSEAVKCDADYVGYDAMRSRPPFGRRQDCLWRHLSLRPASTCERRELLRAICWPGGRLRMRHPGDGAHARACRVAEAPLPRRGGHSRGRLRGG